MDLTRNISASLWASSAVSTVRARHTHHGTPLPINPSHSTLVSSNYYHTYSNNIVFFPVPYCQHKSRAAHFLSNQQKVVPRLLATHNLINEGLFVPNRQYYPYKYHLVTQCASGAPGVPLAITRGIKSRAGSPGVKAFSIFFKTSHL